MNLDLLAGVLGFLLLFFGLTLRRRRDKAQIVSNFLLIAGLLGIFVPSAVFFGRLILELFGLHAVSNIKIVSLTLISLLALFPIIVGLSSMLYALGQSLRDLRCDMELFK